MTKLFNEIQEAFIRANAAGISNQDLTDLVNKEFDLSVTRQQIKTFKRTCKISSGLTGRFEKGHVPKNKGVKGLYNVGGNRTSFKPGQRPTNYKPVGYERVDRDGYILVKVSDSGTWNERWRMKQRIVWEEANGPIPKGHCLVFLDKNKQNVKLDNLRLISRAELARMNQHSLASNNPDVTETGIIIAGIYTQIGKRNKAQRETRNNSSKKTGGG